jgi:hypothetical protein
MRDQTQKPGASPRQRPRLTLARAFGRAALLAHGAGNRTSVPAALAQAR